MYLDRRPACISTIWLKAGWITGVRVDVSRSSQCSSGPLGPYPRHVLKNCGVDPRVTDGKRRDKMTYIAT